MYRFKCYLFWVIEGVKYQAKGYSNTSPAAAYLDAAIRVGLLCDENNVSGDAVIEREGVEYYSAGKPVCPNMWRGCQARIPWEVDWI